MRWLPPGYQFSISCHGEWRASADGIGKLIGIRFGSLPTTRNAIKLALRIAVYNARELCSTRRSSHYYQPGQTPDADANVLTWCGKCLWLGGSGHDSRYPVCSRCRQIERDIEEEAEKAGHLLVNGRIL